MFVLVCYALLCVNSSFAIILKKRRKLVVCLTDIIKRYKKWDITWMLCGSLNVNPIILLQFFVSFLVLHFLSSESRVIFNVL